ncbi:MAG: DUF3078 domain-containing protein [Bacteroidetes bacterium]|nr:DUF3078 domain-containing protein [Bacteroidota bacterium]
MKKLFLPISLIAILVLFSGKLQGAVYTDSLPKDSVAKDTSYWKKGTELGLNAALSGTSPNWSAGAANNLSGNVFLNGLRNYKKEKNSWDNVLKINIGAISSRQLDNFGISYRSTRKNIDNLFFDSKYGHAFSKPKWLSLYAGLNFQTQLLNGFAYSKDSIGREIRSQTTSFMSSGMIVPAVGFEAKPVDWAYARIGVGAIKITTFLNQKLYGIRGEKKIAGVDSGKLFHSELGFQLQAGIAKDLGKQKQYNFKLNYLGFAPYNFSESHSPLDSRVDVNFVAKVGKYINFNYTLISVFDKDLAKPGVNAWQNSWIVGLGFLYKI